MLSSIMIQSWLGALIVVGVPPDSSAHLIDDAKLQAAGMVRYWEAQLPVAPGDSPVEGHLVDEALYVITDGGTLFALQADVGLIRWAEKLTEPDYTIYQPAHIRTADGTGPVVIPTTSEVLIFDRYSGDLMQRFAPGFGAGSAAVAYDGLMFIGSAGGRFYCLQLNHPLARKPFKRWEVITGGPITAAPVLFGPDTLIFASQTGTVYSCRASDKALHWAVRTGGSITGNPAVDESGVYVASTDRSLYKLRHETGRVIWRARLPRPLGEGPVVTAQTVYQYCSEHGLIALDSDTGEEKWRNAAGRAFAAHAPGGDAIFTDDRRLEIVDHETGELRHAIDAPTVVKTVSNPNHDGVFLLGADGRVLCARLSSVPYLRRQQVIAARRRLNLPPADEAARVKRVPEVTGEQVNDLSRDPLRSRRDIQP